MPKLVILDRDGVINQDSTDYVKSADEWVPLSGSLEAIARLNSAGYKVVIATNQSGVGRGYFTMDDLSEMHTKLRLLLAEKGGLIDAIFVCPHKPEDNCRCRKPAPGLFEEIRARYKIDQAAQIYAVGDSLRDLQAATAAGFKPWLVLTGNGQKTRQDPTFDKATPVSDDLASMVNTLLSQVGASHN
ncbi:MAG: D-glycero-beta-D-manno-heptose 1,7-bisphosphate 7-phosphatase [Alcaligenaceae bacterium]|nr:D-glycero-beta-D-manno-heptose 1,7-bisphosphate 7-phosphatase [Alcaligenaceae bacterium]